MADFTNLLGNSENFFKYLFVGAIGLIIFGIVYPKDKVYELQIEYAKFEFQAKSIIIECKTLKKELDRSLNLINSNTPKSLADSIKAHYRSEVLKLEIKKIDAEFQLRKAKILEEQAVFYNKFSWIFIWVGSITGLISGFKWWHLTGKLYEKK